MKEDKIRSRLSLYRYRVLNKVGSDLDMQLLFYCVSDDIIRASVNTRSA
jgi:hypothetical protein